MSGSCDRAACVCSPEEAQRVVGLLQPQGDSDERAVDQAWDRVQIAANQAGEEYLEKVDWQLENGRKSVALNMLHDRELKIFRGTDIWYEMLSKADEVQEELDSRMPAELRTERRKRSRPRPERTPAAERGGSARAVKDDGTVFPTQGSPVEPIESGGAGLDFLAGRPEPTSEPGTSVPAAVLVRDACASLESLHFAEAAGNTLQR